MKRFFTAYLSLFLLSSILIVSALPTMAGRLQSYNGNTGILVMELEDKSIKKFKLSDKTKVEWMGRNTSPAAIRKGSKISIQIAGALNASPLKAAKIVDWSNSDKVVAKGPVNAPYHTTVSSFPSTAGGGGVPDGAPKMNHNHHQTMATIGHGGSQNQPQGPEGHGNSHTGASHSTGAGHSSHSTHSTGGTQHYSNQGASLTAPLELMNIDPYSNSGTGYSQMGQADPGTLMGVDGSTTDPAAGMYGETAYGGGQETISGRVMEAYIEQGYVTLQSFEHPNLQKILLNHAGNAPVQMLVPGQMIEVVGVPTPQGFRAVEIKAAQGGF